MLGVVNYNLVVPRHRLRTGELETIICQLGELGLDKTLVPVKVAYPMYCESVDIEFKEYPGLGWTEHDVTLNVPDLVKKMFDSTRTSEDDFV